MAVGVHTVQEVVIVVAVHSVHEAVMTVVVHTGNEGVMTVVGHILSHHHHKACRMVDRVFYIVEAGKALVAHHISAVQALVPLVPSV